MRSRRPRVMSSRCCRSARAATTVILVVLCVNIHCGCQRRVAASIDCAALVSRAHVVRGHKNVRRLRRSCGGSTRIERARADAAAKQKVRPRADVSLTVSAEASRKERVTERNGRRPRVCTPTDAVLTLVGSCVPCENVDVHTRPILRLRQRPEEERAFLVN
jgi:hypothetical protein